MTDRKNGPATEARDDQGRFAPGNPGRPRGARNRTTQAVEYLLDGRAAALTEKAVELALAGDVTALRLCLDRIAPPRKDNPVTFALPDVRTGADVVNATAALLQAVAGGELTPTEAQAVSNLLQVHAKAAELAEFSERVARMEEKFA